MPGFAYCLFQHLGAAQALHPKRVPSGSFGSHHQRPAAVVAERHIEDGGRGKQSGQQAPGRIRIDSGEKAFGYGLVAVGIEQEAVLFVYAAYFHLHFISGQLGGQ